LGYCMQSEFWEFCRADKEFRTLDDKYTQLRKRRGKINELLGVLGIYGSPFNFQDQVKRLNLNEEQQKLAYALNDALCKHNADADAVSKEMTGLQNSTFVAAFIELQMDKIDHCYEAGDGIVFCDLCNVDIEGTYDQHVQCQTHVCKRNAFLKLNEVPSLLAQDRIDEVKQIFDDNAK